MTALVTAMLATTSMLIVSANAAEEETVGKRPYEMDWANRNQDDHPPLIDFENLDGWTVETKQSEATFARTREQQLWGKYVGKLTYRATGSNPEVRIVPPSPVKIAAPFEAVTCWVYGNNWGFTPDPTTPQVSVAAVFEEGQGQELRLPLAYVNWDEWFLCFRRLTPDQIERAKQGATFKAFVVTGGRNKEDRRLYFDNLAVFVEQFPPRTFDPRPERGIPMFPGETSGTNTGPGKLPFPTRLETILPDNLTKDFKANLHEEGGAFVFTYDGKDGKLTYRLAPKTGMLGDFTAQWQGRGGVVRPCAGGGAFLAGPNGPTAPDKAEPLGTVRKGDTVESKWRLTAGDRAAEVTYAYRLWNKSLVVDVVAPGGEVVEVRYGRATGLTNPRLVTNPYYAYTGVRPAVVVSGPPEAPLFLTGNTDWCLTGASAPFAVNDVQEAGVAYNGGTRYIPLTNGKRNDCYERLFLTLSPRYEEVLPTIPNPKSPWAKVAGTRVWRAHGAGNRENDVRFWTECHRYGMTQVIVTDHETGWRDGGESFTFRTRPAPGKGGDKGQYDYARVMQDKLGFVYGPYNNYTDFAPVNEYWSFDLINRTPDNQLSGAWFRCYAPKPARAVEYCAKLAPQIQEKFHFSTAYCDVHTAVAPWHRVDYDPRVPGAGTSAAVFYAYGEIMLQQKKAWNGPVYSEGGYHFMYCGLTDGNYGQDQQYRPAVNPWLVDFDLRKLHDLSCNFGMGNPEMFYVHGDPPRRTKEEADAWMDRFLAATVAFGHPGFLAYEGGIQNALRSYYMLQQLHSRYCLSSAAAIRYADEKGKLLDTSAAVATGAYKRSQVVTRYANGCVTVVNGDPNERLVVDAYGRKLDLPPNGYAGWTDDGAVEVLSSDASGYRTDYAVTPAYTYVDGRGRFARFAKAGGNGVGICRNLGKGEYEVIPYKGADCGFAVTASSATALDKEGKELRAAEVRTSRGLTYVAPVEGAFSYRLSQKNQPQKAALTCPRAEVVAGERVTVRGKQAHALQIPTAAKDGDRLWRQFEGAWIDFTVVPLVYADLSIEGETLRLKLTSNLAKSDQVALTVGDQTQSVKLEPGRPTPVDVDLGPPERESAELLSVALRAGELSQRIDRGLRTEEGVLPLTPMPDKWQTGMRLRGEAESGNFGQTRGYVTPQSMTCGEVTKTGLFMHPPYMGGTGYSFAQYEPITLPAAPAAAFRASVGKGDGSDPGDGILFKVAVTDKDGKETIVNETTVTEHEWVPLEADLTQWAGQSVKIKVISDVGTGDNSSGDWAAWADMRLETRKPLLTRVLDPNTEAYRREAGPYPVAGLTVEQLRSAKSGWLRYDGNGLSGTGDAYGAFAVLNGALLGNMAPAGGDEVNGIWAEKVGVPLTPEALRTLSAHNTFVLQNPKRDYFKVRRFWLELDLADGRKCSSDISVAAYTQPPDWPYAEGLGVPFGDDITVDVWFKQ
ncbi:MAG: hypothetical protein COZ06_28280 [Armatimonadetes bacterium CG_4_10_14_3_um_filter_66_18]|nr:hypothetical protein [Armatimonadota bacterium]NCO90707.1 hypothetical protein [Armatimonadota bacterium]NDK13252.1 hypothetical protein [Armatimonadota bacterium]OIO93945.1 MAG: hypothetical protein AUJ96_29385 [Armatimonadetes bacterium CG2_30_66_41]PIY40370.1 MAG: hypothetical protein COZ06_28280 [Armatimonadetes bacterium CG_4_10_14_3_um_filter_66_18]